MQVAVCINKTAEKYKQYAKQIEAEDERPQREAGNACQVYATWDGGRGSRNKVNMLEHIAGNLASNGHKSLAGAHKTCSVLAIKY